VGDGDKMRCVADFQLHNQAGRQFSGTFPKYCGGVHFRLDRIIVFNRGRSGVACIARGKSIVVSVVLSLVSRGSFCCVTFILTRESQLLKACVPVGHDVGVTIVSAAVIYLTREVKSC